MSTPLQALERMLLSQERREQSRVQESLSMMQLAQSAAAQRQSAIVQSRQLALQEQKQNIEVMGANIDLLQKVNKTMKTKSASNFLQSSPLSSLYLQYKDEEDGLTEAVKDLTKGSVLIGDDGLELDVDIARDLVAATWSAYEEENPDAIVNIASRLHYITDAEQFENDYDKKLYKSFQQLGILGEGADNQASVNQFKTMKKSLDNDVKLTEEMIEFAKGDFTIDRDFDLISEDLKQLSVDIDPDTKPKTEVDTGFESIVDLQTAIKYADSNTSTLNDKKNLILESIKDLDNSIMIGNAYTNAGIELTEDLKEKLSNQDSMKSELDRRLKEINKEIIDSKKVTRRLISTTEQRRTDIQEKYPLDLIGF
tara:strand:+ start:4590 stop:5693 length:1104 start_codon:yes stop_codon:yes gene_type:complete